MVSKWNTLIYSRDGPILVSAYLHFFLVSAYWYRQPEKAVNTAAELDVCAYQFSDIFTRAILSDTNIRYLKKTDQYDIPNE